MNKVKPTDFAYALSDYFFNYLKVQKGLSENTIQSYNDAISIFLEYCEKERHIRREKIEIRHLNRELVEGFYEWLETEKGNAATTRNLRRAAINAFFRYLQYRSPEHVLLCQNVVSIPAKKAARRVVRHLPPEAIQAIQNQTDLSSRMGQRDFAVLSLMYESAARVTEIASLRFGDLNLEPKAGTVLLHGKGSKQRKVPLVSDMTSIMRSYVSRESRYRPCGSEEPLFCNRNGKRLTRAGIAFILSKYVEKAKNDSPEMFTVTVHPHVLRHSRAMHWLEIGVDLEYIQMLLGHSDLTTTEIYAQISTEKVRKVLESTHPTIETETEQAQQSWTEDTDLMSWLASFQT